MAQRSSGQTSPELHIAAVVLLCVVACSKAEAPPTAGVVDAGAHRGGVPKGEFKNIVGLQNGKMHIVRAVRGNVANGARVTLLASGNMLGVQHYVDGVPNGPFIELFADGGVAQMGNKRADKKHGIWRSFDKDGRMTQEATFADGVLVNGEWEGR